MENRGRQTHGLRKRDVVDVLPRLKVGGGIGGFSVINRLVRGEGFVILENDDGRGNRRRLVHLRKHHRKCRPEFFQIAADPPDIRFVRVADDEEILRAHAQPFVRGVTGAGEGAEEQEQENCRERPQDWNCRSAAGWSVHARLHERASAGCSGLAKSFRLHGFLKYTRRPRR